MLIRNIPDKKKKKKKKKKVETHTVKLINVSERPQVL